MSTPYSMQRVANSCCKSWWVIRFTPVSFELPDFPQDYRRLAFNEGQSVKGRFTAECGLGQASGAKPFRRVHRQRRPALLANSQCIHT
jgi:hypothetical protein